VTWITLPAFVPDTIRTARRLNATKLGRAAIMQLSRQEMTMFEHTDTQKHDQRKATEPEQNRDQLSDEDLEMAAGGLNPQPLPPGIIRDPNFHS
jgi:hypothetical protein